MVLLSPGAVLDEASFAATERERVRLMMEERPAVAVALAAVYSFRAPS